MARPGRYGAAHRRGLASVAPAVLAVAVVLTACDSGAAATPRITPGTTAAPRELNLIAKDYTFVPAIVDLVPGETVVLHFVNGGEVIHEAVFGGAATQAAWETAEAGAAGAPPGPTPVVSAPAPVAGLRVVASSGQRTDARWTVPVDGPAIRDFVVACHIPGHFAQGMVVPVRWVGADGRPLDALPSSAAPAS